MKGNPTSLFAGMAACAALFLASCSSTYQAGSSGNNTDDVYYKPHPEGNNPSSASSPGNGNAGTNAKDDYYDPNYQANSSAREGENNGGSGYNSDDNYDYSYSARIKRFYTPVSGAAYYDPYYTNSYYYDNNPASWGASIYLGYPFWGFGLSYGSYSGWGLSFGFGWGYPYYGYGYPYYGYPYYGYGYPYYGYGYPYYNCFYPGYYYGCGYGCGYGYSYYNPCYYNSYDGCGGVYYGPRGSVSSNGRSAAERAPRSVGSSYESAVIGGRLAAVNPELADRLNTDHVVAPNSESVTNPSRQQSISEKNAQGHPSTPNATPSGRTNTTASPSEGAGRQTAPSSTSDGRGTQQPGGSQQNSGRGMQQQSGNQQQNSGRDMQQQNGSQQQGSGRSYDQPRDMQQQGGSRSNEPARGWHPGNEMPAPRSQPGGGGRQQPQPGGGRRQELDQSMQRSYERGQERMRSYDNSRGSSEQRAQPSAPRSNGSIFGGGNSGGGRSSGGSSGGGRSGGSSGGGGGRSSGGRR